MRITRLSMLSFSNNKTASRMSVEEFIRIKKCTKDITSFNYYAKKASQEFCGKSDSKINRKNLINYFKNNYYGKAFFIFTVKWL